MKGAPTEKIVCEKQAGIVRFWYEHHPESAWEIDFEVSPEGHTVFNRALTIHELRAVHALIEGRG